MTAPPCPQAQQPGPESTRPPALPRRRTRDTSLSSLQNSVDSAVFPACSAVGTGGRFSGGGRKSPSRMAPRQSDSAPHSIAHRAGLVYSAIQARPAPFPLSRLFSLLRNPCSCPKTQPAGQNWPLIRSSGSRSHIATGTTMEGPGPPTCCATDHLPSHPSPCRWHSHSPGTCPSQNTPEGHCRFPVRLGMVGRCLLPPLPTIPGSATWLLRGRVSSPGICQLDTPGLLQVPPC